MQVSANDLICISGEIVEQQSGAWTARIEVDDEENAITGDCTIKVGTETFVGTVVRGEVPEGRGRWIGHVVGGRGGLETELDATHYFSATLQTIVQDALAGAGEALDIEGTEASALAAFMPRWTRTKDRARIALTAIARKMGGFWRVNRGGGVVFRTGETWEEPDFEFTYIDADPSDGTLEIAPEETPAARPGVTVGGNRVAAVTTHWAADGVRQHLTVASEDGATRGLGAVFAEQIKKASEAAIHYSRWYPSKVVRQDPDGTVHLIPDDARVRGNGLAHIPIRHGVPGLTVRVALGMYVRLFFEDGDPSKPACALWEDGSSVLDVTMQCLQGVHFVAPQITFGPTANPTQSALLGEFMMTYIDGITNAVIGALNLITPGPTSSGGAPAAAALQAALAALTAAKQAALSPFIKLQ
jgi:hypothetical protein